MADNEREALAVLIHKTCGCDGTCPLDAEDAKIADAILARWRLVPVDVADSAPPPDETFNAITDWREPVPGWETETIKEYGSAIITRTYVYPKG